MDAEEQRKKKNEAIKREMVRKSNDEILIYNPRLEDWPIKYGGYTHIVPHKDKNVGHGLGCLVVARYLAVHYVNKIVDQFIIEENERRSAKAKKEYKGAHWPEEEQKIAIRTDNVELRRQYMTGLWKGIVRKFGLDESPEVVADKPKDIRPTDIRLIDEMEKELEREANVVPAELKPKKKPKTKQKIAKEEFSESIKEKE